MAAASLATLRSKIEGDLRGRVPAPFTYLDRNVFELVSTGIPEIDILAGGLPRGAMTEICGAACSGRTSFLLAALASRTADGEVCALVDARDSFDPATAQAAGVALQQLLWVRCHDIDQALRATDLLIQSGGFGLVAVDLSDVPAKTVRQVPLNVWFRFRRAVEDTPTILLVLDQEPNAKTCASLVLQLKTKQAHWSDADNRNEGLFQGLKPLKKVQPLMSDLKVRPPKEKSSALFAPKSKKLPPSIVQKEPIGAFSLGGRGFQPRHKESQGKGALAPEAKLLQGYAVCGEVIRSRIQLPPTRIINIRAKNASAQSSIFETQTVWSDFSKARIRY